MFYFKFAYIFHDKIALKKDKKMDIKKILFRTNSIDVEKSLPDALVYIAKDGKILWVNDVASDIFTTSKMHLMTSNIEDFIENSLNMVTNAVIVRKPVITKCNDSEKYLDMTAREISDGFVLSFRPTAEAVSEAELDDSEEVNREKNNFLIKLTNDLKSPIQSIVGFSQAMADGLGGSLSEQQEKYIRIINKNSTELMYFVGKLLELSHTELSASEPDKKMMDILALVNNVVRFNEHLYKEKEVSLSVTQEPDFKKMITSDSDILKNILQDVMEVVLKSVDMGDININLSNPDEEFLSSKSIVAGDYVLISVSSSALLLSENDLDCIFDPYKIVDSTNRKNVLRAIVLSSVKNMVQSLGGVIWVESQILKNTSFNLIIPA